MTKQPKPPLTTLERIDRDLGRIWLALIVTVIMVGITLGQNAIRASRVEGRIIQLQSDKEALLRERAELLKR